MSILGNGILNEFDQSNLLADWQKNIKRAKSVFEMDTVPP